MATSAQGRAPEAPGGQAAPLGRGALALRRPGRAGGGDGAAGAGGTTLRARGNDGVIGKVAAATAWKLDEKEASGLSK